MYESLKASVSVSEKMPFITLSCKYGPVLIKRAKILKSKFQTYVNFIGTIFMGRFYS